METVVIFSASAVAILGVLYNTFTRRAVDESTNTAIRRKCERISFIKI